MFKNLKKKLNLRILLNFIFLNTHIKKKVIKAELIINNKSQN